MTALSLGSGLFAPAPSPKPADERWLPVVGYEGLYEVSSLGNLRSLARAGGNGKTYGGRPLSTIASCHGYLVVNLSKGNRVRQYRVHRLVAAAFLGPCPDRMVVAYGDGDRANNRLANLRYASNRENEEDKSKHGTRAQGETHGRAVLTEQIVRRIRCSGLSPKDAAARFSISPSQAGRILRREGWRHVA